MPDLADWLPPAMIGLTFTIPAGLKLYGLKRGIVGGRDKPAVQRLCGI